MSHFSRPQVLPSPNEKLPTREDLAPRWSSPGTYSASAGGVFTGERDDANRLCSRLDGTSRRVWGRYCACAGRHRSHRFVLPACQAPIARGNLQPSSDRTDVQKRSTSDESWYSAAKPKPHRVPPTRLPAERITSVLRNRYARPHCARAGSVDGFSPLRRSACTPRERGRQIQAQLTSLTGKSAPVAERQCQAARVRRRPRAPDGGASEQLTSAHR